MTLRDAHGMFAPETLPRVAWHVSNKSTSGGANCVEAGPVRDHSGRIAARHSQRPHGPAFVYTRADWGAFLAAAKRGTLDF